jgi:hypothetical protein
MRYFVFVILAVFISTVSVSAQSGTTKVGDAEPTGFQLTEAQIKLLEQAGLPKDLNTVVGASVCLKLKNSSDVSCGSVTNVDIVKHTTSFTVNILYLSINELTLGETKVFQLYFVHIMQARYGKSNWGALAMSKDTNVYTNYDVLVNFKIK